MSASLTSTLTRSHLTQSHGKLSNISFEAMDDVDRDGQHPSSSVPSTLHSDDKDTMDTSLDTTQSSAMQEKTSELPSGNDGATTQQPASAPVLDQPREGGGVSGSAQEAQSQLAPLPLNAPLTHNPLLTSNLISLYGLDTLAKSVARVNPKTGEGNKLRKSYEGQLKTLGLAGRNKAVKHDSNDETKGMGLVELTKWPEEEWQNQKVSGKDVKNGLPDLLKGKLEKAMQMVPGPVPNNDSWEELLGIDKAKPVDATKAAKSSTAMKANGQQPNGVRPHNGTTSASQAAEPIRARRTTKKRRYDDGSFEGYGEGFVDDEMEAGYSSGESRSTKASTGNRKRRKTKDYNSPTEYGGGSRNNSFTAGPVGISAYGR